MERAVDGDFVEVESDHPVERGDCFCAERVEDPGVDPLVSAGSQGGVGDLVVKDRSDVDPRRSSDQSDEQAAQAEAIGDSGSVAAEWVRSVRRWEQRFDRCPYGIEHLGL